VYDDNNGGGDNDDLDIEDKVRGSDIVTVAAPAMSAKYPPIKLLNAPTGPTIKALTVAYDKTIPNRVVGITAAFARAAELAASVKEGKARRK